MARASRLLWILPVLLSVLLYGGTRTGDFVFEEAWLIRKDEPPRPFDFKRSFYGDYRGAMSRVDRDYRPLTHLTYDLNFRRGEEAADFHSVNVILNAVVTFLVYLVLLELLGDAWLATLGAALFAVLPIHTQTVAEISGRYELLGGIAIFAVWLLALANSPPKGAAAPAENLMLTVVAVAVAFLGFFSSGWVVVVLPLILVGSWVLGRRTPWWTIAGSASAFLGYLLVRWSVRAAGWQASFVENPLTEADALTRVLNGITLVGRYLGKIVAPIELSVSYAQNAIPVLPLKSPLLWLAAAGVVGLFAGIFWLARRARWPLLGLAAVFFLLTILPVANIFFVVEAIFSEPFAYVPSFAYPLALCAVLGASPWPWTRLRGLPSIVLCALLVLYGSRTLSRNREWAEPDAATLERRLSTFEHARSQHQKAQNQLDRSGQAPSEAEKKGLIAEAKQLIDKALETFPPYIRAEMLYAKVLFNEGDLKGAIERYDRAEKLLVAKKRPARDTLDVIRLRGECRLRLVERLRQAGGDNTVWNAELDKAIRDFSRHIDIEPSGTAHNSRGIALAQLGRLKEALAEFDRAVELDPNTPAHWSNHGRCRSGLGDWNGALEDYAQGYRVCEDNGLRYLPPPADSMYGLLEKIAEIYRHQGNEAEAARFHEGAEKIRAEAQPTLPPGIGK